MKNRIQGIIIGFMAVILFSSITVWAAVGTEIIEAIYREIKIIIDGELITPKDPNGNTVEPFIYNGTTYLPVRAIGEAYGKPVDWEGETSTVYIGKWANRPATEVFLYDKPYVEINGEFGIGGNDMSNFIQAYSTRLGSAGSYYHSTKAYVIYSINGFATKFKATLNPPPSKSEPLTMQYASDDLSGVEQVYKIYGDGTLIYQSPIMTPNVESVPVELDIAGFMEIKIETEYNATKVTSGHQSTVTGYFRNARIVTTDAPALISALTSTPGRTATP